MSKNLTGFGFLTTTVPSGAEGRAAFLHIPSQPYGVAQFLFNIVPSGAEGQKPILYRSGSFTAETLNKPGCFNPFRYFHNRVPHTLRKKLIV
jgi:hypothetical protein